MDDQHEEPITGEARALDEELERFRHQPGDFDPARHRRRNRLLVAIGVGALGAGLVFVVLTAFDQARNPCQRVRDHFCGLNPQSAPCKSYESILQESIEETSPMARSAIRQQCETRINRLKIDDGIKVR
jgi:hypothetical protein